MERYWKALHHSDRTSDPQTSFHLLVLALFLAWPFKSSLLHAASVEGIGVAAPNVITILVQATSEEEIPSQATGNWLINGSPVSSVGRSTYVWDQGKNSSDITLRHQMYLRMDKDLVEGAVYDLVTPFGSQTLHFVSSVIPSESIKINQVGYVAHGTPYAVFAAYLGDLGTVKLANSPHYRVVNLDGLAVVEGDGIYRGLDDAGPVAGGEHVYTLDLSSVPQGGPYRVVVAGVGSSSTFGIGDAYVREIAYTAMRGLYHQRCGIALVEPFTSFLRGMDHDTVMVTDAEPPGFIDATGPSRPMSGGYHDAGDFDRRQSHTLIPAWLLTIFDAFPDRFGDGSLNLPESGNGIPDLLDEALWGVRQWEALQEEDGGVRAGVETTQHPTYGDVNAATDTLIYRTYRRDGHTTASAAGLFAQAARLVKPYDATRSEQLLARAVAAWNWVQVNDPPSAKRAQRMYAALQLYLATGETTYHDRFREYIASLDGAAWPEQYHMAFYNLNTIVDGMIFAPYFAPYLWTTRPTDNATRDILMKWLNNSANAVLTTYASKPYSIGAASSTSWGAVTNQGRYADALIYRYRINGDVRDRDAVARIADYPLGLNPLGKSFITGLGRNPPHTPLHLDSWFTEQNGLGSVPGITVYGPVTNPSSITYQAIVWQKAYPAWSMRPPARRYTEGWSFVEANEFSTWETVATNAVMYGFLVEPPDVIFQSGFEH